jgi:ribosomal protein S18 acetylase RimI-like enzyme
MNIVEITEGKGALCGDILATLPAWFGLPDVNAAYVRNVEDMPMFAADVEGSFAGFLSLKLHTQFAAEIYVLGIKPDYHRRGIGRALIARVEAYLRSRRTRFLTVKTLSPVHSDENYAKTRKFYAAMGFVPIDEAPASWGSNYLLIMMAKTLD